MNVSIKKILAIVILSLILLPTSMLYADTQLDLVPAEALITVRINNLEQATTAFDDYLMGISPIGLNMMIKMQLGQLINDPMLTGLDTKGTFTLFVLPNPLNPQNPPAVYLMLPVNDYNEFINANGNIATADDNGFSSLNTPVMMFQNPVVFNPKKISNVAIISSHGNANYYLEKATTSIKTKLSSEELPRCTSAPIWLYADMENVTKSYGDLINAQFQSMVTNMPEDQQTQNASMQLHASKILQLELQVLMDILEQTQSISAVIKPEFDALKISEIFASKKGSTMAKMLVKDPQVKYVPFKLTSYLDEPHAVNGLMRNNKVLMRKLNESFFEFFTTHFPVNSDTDNQTGPVNFKKFYENWIDLVGQETAMGFSYIGQKPFFAFNEFYNVTDSKRAYDLIGESFPLISDLYSQMGIPFTFNSSSDTSTYNGVQLQQLTGKMNLSEMSAANPNPCAPSLDFVNEFTYHHAAIDTLGLLTCGPDGDKKLKKYIDKTKNSSGSASQPTADIQTALKYTNEPEKADLIVSFNLLRLASGFGSMIKNLMGNNPMMMPFADMFADLGANSKSCLVLSAKIKDGNIYEDVVLPKAHLMEIVTAIGEIQKKQMEMQAQTQAANSIKNLIGQPAPDLTLTDLEGNTITLSELKGKRVVLDFWATWCPPCKMEIPHFIELRNSTDKDKIAIIGISNEPASTIKAFAEKNKINYTLVSYPAQYPGTYSSIQALPTTIIIDAEGKVENVLEGYHPPAVLKSNALGKTAH